MLQYQEGDVRVEGINIHYYRTGSDKPPFVLLHGATDNGLCWTPVAGMLAEDYDVIMVDAQGHGKSDRVDPRFNSNSLASQVVGLLKELGIKKPVIMGHSMGAGTTVNIAVNYPDVPRAIILEDPVWRPPEVLNAEPSAEEKRIQEGFARLVENQGKLNVAEIIEQGRKDNPRWSEEELKPWAEAKKQFDPSLLKRVRPDSRPYEGLVPKIQCPTLLITAENGIVPPGVPERAAALWKSDKPFKWVRIDGAGHNIRREQYEEFKRNMTQFLGALAG
ncbi:MAG: alpha/beta hydrolase [Dehalococcoidales bacterium]|nr:alpha/beta hydrolase [Dehalococcoidales bacterium]